MDGADAGVVVPASPEVGLAYRKEYYEGEAEDAGEILSLDEQVEVPFGAYDDVVMTKDTTPLEPDVPTWSAIGALSWVAFVGVFVVYAREWWKLRPATVPEIPAAPALG